MPKEVEQAMEIEAIAQRYGQLPTAVMAAPASLIRHYRLVSRVEGGLAELAGDEE